MDVDEVEGTPVKGIPAVALRTADIIEDGNTKIHKYPGEDNRREINTVLAMWATRAHKDRIPIRSVTEALNESFPDLDVTETNVVYYVDNYIAPALARMMPNIVQRRLIEEGHELDTASKRGRLMQRTEKVLDDLEKVPEDGRNKQWHDAYSKHMSSLNTMMNDWEKSLEKFHVHEPRAQEMHIKKESVSLNVSETLDKLGLGKKPDFVDV